MFFTYNFFIRLKLDYLQWSGCTMIIPYSHQKYSTCICSHSHHSSSKKWMDVVKNYSYPLVNVLGFCSWIVSGVGIDAPFWGLVSHHITSHQISVGNYVTPIVGWCETLDLQISVGNYIPNSCVKHWDIETNPCVFFAFNSFLRFLRVCANFRTASRRQIDLGET